MRVLYILLASTARAALAANDTDEYVNNWVNNWARAGEKDRCDAKNCEWMAGFGAIDVGCRIQIDSAGLANDSTPAFSLEFNDHVLSIDARCASSITRFRTRPALCEYVPATARQNTSEVALLMVANAPAYLFRLWGPFLNKLLFATDAGLRPFLWLGDMPSGLRKPTSDACLHSREMRHILGHHRRLGRSFYEGHINAGECSNHYVRSRRGEPGSILKRRVDACRAQVKMPATLATLAHPEIKGLYYLDLDAVSRFPWTHHGEPGIKQHLKQEHERGYSAVAFSRGSNSKRFGKLRWQVHGSVPVR
jgi:hypothetical protein